jgi:hypothetical protein
VTGEYKGFLSNFTEADVLTRINFYCRDDRSDVLVQAAIVVIADLMATQASQMPKSLKKP